MHKQIKSLQNPTVKRILQLQDKSRLRKKEGLFIIEGKRELSLARKGGYSVTDLYFCSDLLPDQELQAILPSISAEVNLVEITREVYQKVAYRSGTEGILAIARSKELSLENLELNSPHPLILVAEAPEKPGNIGALLRTADAANVDAVLIANPKTDLFNPNIIRSSVGCVFTNPIATGSSAEIISFLKNRKINIYAAALQASAPYHRVDFSTGSAIVVGTEASGLNQEWLDSSTQNIIIPMQGEIDSMNVSVAAGILIFEAKRQRDFQ